MRANKKDQPLVFAHIGDLHITRAKEQNYIDMLSILSQIETECSANLDFVVLPGDNADNGLPQQYKLIATGLKMLSVPVHVIPGDHDMEQGSLEGFYTMPMAEQLPKSLTAKDVKCLFLDVSGPGMGGPDFRLGNEQLLWLQKEMDDAKNNQKSAVIFVHTYPGDLKDEIEKDAFNQMIAGNDVTLVDMGHTHYNELSNDGSTIFSATRSTGQIEEGPVGYSMVSIDNGVVSWRFKPLHEAFPFVMITTPADYRLIRKQEQLVSGDIEIRAVIFSLQNIETVKCKIENGSWLMMSNQQHGSLWSARVSIPGKLDKVNLTVEAIDETGRPGMHSIQLAKRIHQPVIRSKSGSDADSIGSWPENGILGTQLGPNRNAKPISKPK